MLSPEDIRRRALARYPDFLRSLVNGTVFFPLPIRFGKPSATEDFVKLRREIKALTEASLGCNIDWIDVNSRRWGKQRLPERVDFSDETSYLRALGKTKEVVRFRENLALTRDQCPLLVSFAQQRPLDVVEFADAWPGLLEVCCYFQLHPRPNLYARELPLSVDTKFVERHQSVLARLMSIALPPEAIVEAERFEESFGLRYDEPQIRLRLLDKSLQAGLGIPFCDMALPLEQFRSLAWHDLQVIVSENKMTFLTLPSLPRAVGIWGAGNAAALLHSVPWFSDCDLFYWGDLDLQGLEILSRMRKAFPKVRALMMDVHTMRQFRDLASKTSQRGNEMPSHLTEYEQAAWSTIRAESLRLEQERIPFQFVCEILQNVSSHSPLKNA